MTVVHAPAKLTWSLAITGRRPDGLHTIDAEMVTLELGDSLELADAGDSEPRFEVVTEAPATAKDAVLGPDDLVRRALRAVHRHAHVSLTKRIPLGAGLGGGSADAAAVLRWAGVADASVAASLGADVPFCVVGGRARVTGVGEAVEPLASIARTVTLALVDFGVDTAACYRTYDALEPAARHDQRNDLTAAAFAVAPALRTVRDGLGSLLGCEFVLAGSGSTLFCEGDPMALGPGGVAEVVLGTERVRLLTTRSADAG